MYTTTTHYDWYYPIGGNSYWVARTEYTYTPSPYTSTPYSPTPTLTQAENEELARVLRWVYFSVKEGCISLFNYILLQGHVLIQ